MKKYKCQIYPGISSAEGFGIQNFPKYTEDGDAKCIFFFKPKSQLQSPQESKLRFVVILF